jgi:hypothetical protein
MWKMTIMMTFLALTITALLLMLLMTQMRVIFAIDDDAVVPDPALLSHVRHVSRLPSSALSNFVLTFF